MFSYAFTYISYFVRIEQFTGNSIYHSIFYRNKKVSDTSPSKFLYIQYVMQFQKCVFTASGDGLRPG